VRAIAWKVTGNRHLAVRIAAGAGQVLGGLLIAIGLFEVFFVPAAFVNGLWLAFLGWFLASAASSEAKAEELRRTLAARPLRRFASRAFDPIPADATVDDAVERWFRLYDRGAFLVADEPGPIVGVLTLDDVRRVPPEARGRVLVQDVMRSVDDLPWLEADTPASAVLDQLEADGVAVVFDDAEPLGLVTLPDVLTRLRRDEELGRAPAVAA
jgi:CBS domain-containing protein